MKLYFYFTQEQESLLLHTDIAACYGKFLGDVMWKIHTDYIAVYNHVDTLSGYDVLYDEALEVQISAPRLDEMELHPVYGTSIQTLPPKCNPLTPYTASMRDFALTVYILEHPLPNQSAMKEAHTRRLVYRLEKNKFVLVEDSHRRNGSSE